MNAPFSCPNSSLSSSPAGIAAQFTFNKCPLTASAQPVNCARKQFFSGSGLALNQDRGISGGDCLNLFKDLPQASTLSDDVLKPILEIDFLFEIQLFLPQPVTQFRDLFKDHRIANSHRHLISDLVQHLPLPIGEGGLGALATASTPTATSRWIKGTQQPDFIPIPVR